jgi:DNA-binding winged helix-turn-helix (wHTH) protein/tetratricopeptide (TPR) repeat protein/TolB-like protein
MASQNAKVTFGRFSFDMELGRLTRHGRRILLPDKNAKLLAYLISKEGALARREDVRLHLWPNNAPHDAEQAINKAISQLRTALGDSSDAPKYIETIPRRGYRFCAPIEFAPADCGLASASETAQVQTIPEFAPPSDSVQTSTRFAEENSAAKPSFWGRNIAISSARIPVWWIVAVAAVLLITSVLGWRYLRTPRIGRDAPITIGIASFSSEGQGADTLAKGLRFDLTDSLSDLPHTKMVPATSTEDLRADGTLKQKAAALGLDVVIFGHIALNGDTCDLQFELVRVRDVAHLTTLHYTGQRDNLLAINLRFQNDVFSILQRVGTDHALSGGTSNPQAYHAYLQGLMQSNQYDPESAQLALRSFQQASTLDPQYAAAFSMIGYEQMMLYHSGVGEGDPFLHEAEQAAKTALKLDPLLAAPHTVLGEVLFERWQIEPALREYRMAVQLSPNSVRAHASLAWILARTPFKSEHVQEAEFEIAKAHELAPYNVAIYMNESFIAYSFHDCARAMQIVDKLNTALNDNEATLRLNAQSLWACGHEQQAIETWKRMAEVQHFPFGVELQDRGLKAWQSGGSKAYAQVILHAIQAGKIPDRFADPYDEALWDFAAGERKAALALIHQRFNEHNWAFLSDAEAPELVQLREDPEFQSMLNKVYR